MPRITLAHWYDGHAPGEQITVDDNQLHDLIKDGRVATVLNTPDTETAVQAPVPDTADTPLDTETTEPAEPAPAARRKGR